MGDAKIFEDVTIKWGAQPYLIKSDDVMGAILRIEQHVTLKELHDMLTERRTLKLATIAMAYASLLRYAGAKVQDGEVYKAMFDKTGGTSQAVTAAVQGLLVMMVPTAKISESLAGDSSGKSKPAAVKSSPKPTARRSANGV